MAETELNVKATADINQLVVAMKQCADAVKEASQQMQGSLSGAISEESANKAVGALEQIKGVTESLLGSFESLKGLAEGVGKAFGFLAGAVAGGEMFEKAMERTTSWDEKVRTLSLTLGEAPEKVSGLAFALEKSGVGVDAYAKMTERLGREVSQNPEKFEQLKIAIRDADGAFLPLNEVMQNSINRFREFTPGTQLEAESLLFGRHTKEMREAIDQLTDEALANGEKQAAALGLGRNQDQIDAMKEYKDAQNELDLAFTALAVVVGTELYPKLTELAEWFVGIAPEGMKTVKGLVEGLEGVWEGLAAVLTSYTELLTIVSDLWFSLTGAMDGSTQASRENVTWGEALGVVLRAVGAAIYLVGESFKEVLHVLEGFGEMLGTVGGFVWNLKESIVGLVETAVAGFGAILGVFESFASGDFKGAATKLGNVASVFGDTFKAGVIKPLKEGFNTVEDSWNKVTKTIEDDESRIRSKLSDIMGLGEKPAPSDADTSPGHSSPPQDKEDFQGDRSAEILKKTKEHIEELKGLRENWFTWSAAREQKYWDEALSQVSKGQKEYLAIYTKTNETRKKALEDSIKETEAKIKSGAADDLRFAQEELANAKATADQKRLLLDGEIKTRQEQDKIIGQDAILSASENLKLLESDKARKLAIISEELAATKKALQDELGAKLAQAEALAQLDRNNKELYEKDLADIKAANDNFNKAIKAADDSANTKKIKADQDATKERIKLEAEAAKEIGTFMQPFVKGFSDGIAKMIQGTLSFKDAIAGLGKMLISALGDAVAQMVQNFIAGLARQAAAWLAHLLFQQTTESSSDATRLAAGAAIRVAEAEGEASVAAINAGASVAAIPFIGWGMAEEVAATTYGIMQGYVATAASGGFDIPSGVNPITQLHAEEMVLPAHLANAVRSMAGADGSGGMGGDVHVHISAVDAPGVARLFQQHDSTISQALKGYARGGKLRGRK